MAEIKYHRCTIRKRYSKMFTISIAFLLAACSISRQPVTGQEVQKAPSPSPEKSTSFPLARGSYWVYEGRVKGHFNSSGSSKGVEERDMVWRMEVVQVYQRDAITGYEMKGAPWDLAWYVDGDEPSIYAFIQIEEKYYKTSFDTLKRLIDEKDDLLNLVSGNEIFLGFPLTSGGKFCDSVSMTRADGRYCWVVGDGNQFDASSVAGIDLPGTLMEYPVYNYTNPDHSGIYFVPGVGITRYVYVHHGTVSEVDVKLTEYHPGN